MKTNKQAVARLYKYRNALHRLRTLGFVRVFSDNLADAIGVTSSQVRKDFSIFAIVGNKRGGYSVDELIANLDGMLGKDTTQRVIMVGAGHIGMALMNYPGFEKENIKIEAVFDIDPGKLDEQAAIPVLPLETLRDFVSRKHIKVGIIATPEIAAQQICDMMVAAGISGIVNFAPIRLKVPEDCLVNNINVCLELETALYFVNISQRQKV